MTSTKPTGKPPASRLPSPDSVPKKSEQDILDNGDIDTLKQHFETAIRTILTAEAEGEADVLSATFPPTVKHLIPGKTVLVRAKQKNTGKSPAFSPNRPERKKSSKETT